MNSTLTELQEEAESSRAKYGPYSSAHEAFGVLSEEVLELLDAIHRNDADAIAHEALQVSAVALRLSLEIRTVPAMRDRSGCTP